MFWLKVFILSLGGTFAVLGAIEPDPLEASRLLDISIVFGFILLLLQFLFPKD